MKSLGALGLSVVSFQWSVVSGQWWGSGAVGQWAVGSRQWAVGSGQWAVGSGQFEMRLLYSFTPLLPQPRSKLCGLGVARALPFR